MMCEIKFRGKRVTDGVWIYGAYVHNNGKPFIISHNVVDYDEDYFCPEFWWRVIPETVGQFTGLKDKNGVEVYKGDVVKMASKMASGIYVVIWDDYRVAWWLKNVKADIREVNRDDDYCQLLDCSWHADEREIIGNKWENPDLLEVGK